MKKLVLSMAVVAAATMVSCGNKAENAAEAADSTAVVEGVVVDETEVVVSEEEAPSILDNIKSAASAENVQKGIAYVKSLLASGKLAEARTYLDQIKPYADKVGMSSALATVSTALEQAEGVAGNVVGDVKDQASAAVEDAKAKAAGVVEEAKDKAASAVEDAKAKAAEAGANAVKNLLK